MFSEEKESRIWEKNLHYITEPPRSDSITLLDEWMDCVTLVITQLALILRYVQVVEMLVRMDCKGCERSVRKAVSRIRGERKYANAFVMFVRD